MLLVTLLVMLLQFGVSTATSLTCTLRADRGCKLICDCEGARDSLEWEVQRPGTPPVSLYTVVYSSPEQLGVGRRIFISTGNVVTLNSVNETTSPFLYDSTLTIDLQETLIISCTSGDGITESITSQLPSKSK